jgi:hypothetical protein
MIADYLDNIDLAGTSLRELANRVTEEALTVGRVGLLVDYPVADTSLTLADTNALGLRPLITLYKAESIINWRQSKINGSTVLSLVVLKETEELPGDDEFKSVLEDRYRVLDLIDGKYRQRLFRRNEKNIDEQIGDDVYPLMNGPLMDFIPFIFIGVDSLDPDVYPPPLIDLVDANFHHYQQSSAYERGCFFSGLPTLFITGYQPDDNNAIYIGGNQANVLPQPDAKAYFVEVGSEFNALRNNLSDKKQEMALLGARMMESQKAGVESSEAIARRQNGEESILADMAQTISEGMTKALRWFAQWQGVEDTSNIRYQLNRDFLPMQMSAQDIQALVGAWQQGAISNQTLFDNLKAGEVIEPDVTFEEEQERINSAAPVLSMAA